MTTLVCNAVADIKVEERTFKAWRAVETVFPKLCMVMIPPGLTFFSDEELYKIFVAQNRLQGDHDKAKFSGGDAKGYRRLLIGASEDFAIHVRRLGGIAGIAGFTVKCHIKN